MEIFLVIIEKDSKAWVASVMEALSSYDSIGIQEFAGLWAETLFSNKRLLELTAILNTVIERNVSVEALSAWKKSMFESVSALSNRMLQIIPNMTSEQSFMFFNFQMHYAIGLYPATKSNEILDKALAQSGIPNRMEMFVPAFSRFLAIVLRGLIVQ